MTYKENRAECESAGYVKHDPDGMDVCGVQSGLLCCGDSCPSKKYWNSAHRQPGWYKHRALERTGLKKQFEEEIAEL